MNIFFKGRLSASNPTKCSISCSFDKKHHQRWMDGQANWPINWPTDQPVNRHPLIEMHLEHLKILFSKSVTLDTSRFHHNHNASAGVNLGHFRHFCDNDQSTLYTRPFTKFQDKSKRPTGNAINIIKFDN